MNHPYRKLYVEEPVKLKRRCFFFHEWFPSLKPNKEMEIRDNIKVLENNRLIYVNLFNDYNLICTICGAEKDMDFNLTYLNLAMEDAKEKFSKNQ